MPTVARFCRALLLLVAAQLTLAGAGAAHERRIALVIGNGQYEAVTRLPNPGPDAEMIAASFREAGFDAVSLATDLTRERLIDALRRFAAEAERVDWAVIYYAGHGIEMNGMNYLIPVDARLKTDRDLQFEAVSMTQVLTSVEGARKLRLVILDACRDNPFAASMTRGTGATRSIGRGLAQIEPEAGTLVAYAAKHGQVAEDGVGAHSPFVSALTRHITTPGLEINRLFRRVTSDVLLATNRRQLPFTYGSLPDEDFYFRPPLAPPPAPEPVRVETPPAAAPAPALARPGASAAVQPAPAPENPAKVEPVKPEPVKTDPAKPEPAKPEPAKPEPAGAQTVEASRPALPVPDAIRPAPQAQPAKKIATVDPAAPPAVVVQPAAPRVRARPLARPRPAERPVPVAPRPKRVAQAAEERGPRPVRPALRPAPARASAARSGRCFIFNGERVCE